MTHEPDEKSRRTVQTMAGYGVLEEEIAYVLDITEPTLRKYYKRELKLGFIAAKVKVAEALFMRASDKGDNFQLSAAIWWEKTRCGYSEFAPWRAQPGKKETALIEARSAHKNDDEWAELVDPSLKSVN